MASKTKMRCNSCSKWFQSANAKDITCQECVQKARKEKLAAKAVPPAPAKAIVAPQAAAQPRPKPKDTQSGTNSWFDKVSDVKVAKPDEPTRPKIPFSPTPRDIRGSSSTLRPADGDMQEEQDVPKRSGPGAYRDGAMRPANGPYRVGGGAGLPDAGPRPRQPMEGVLNRGLRVDRPDKSPRLEGQGGAKFDKPKVKTLRPQSEPKPKHEKIEPPKPFEPTSEQVTQVEARYLELATPAEFDGIRTQIAKELAIPKTAVKKIIKELRDQQHIKSWWETQTYKGNEEEMTKIRAAYEPSLPLPNIGIHKKIADGFSLKRGEVYQAIKLIRADMGLPQYNDPALHGLTLTSAKSEPAQDTPPTNTEHEVTERQESETSAASDAAATEV